MGEEETVKQQAKALKEDMKVYSKLKKLSNSAEVNELIDLFIRTASQKMVWSFTGDNIKSWDQFCKVRGEIVAYLFPIQEIRSAEAMEKHIKEQLDSFYNPPNV